MLGKPENGWTSISVGNEVIGGASYLTDVPMDILDSLIDYFSSLRNEKNVKFEVVFDAEGWMFGITQIMDDLYVYDSRTDDIDKLNLKRINPEIYGMKAYAQAWDTLQNVAREVVDDIFDNIDGWVHWMSYDDSTEEEFSEREDELTGKCFQLLELVCEGYSEAKDKEELIEEFIDHIHSLIDYWENEERSPTSKEKLEGLAFSILVTLDGGSDIGGYKLMPCSYPEDAVFEVYEDRKFSPVDYDIAGYLHERFYKEN